MRFWAFLLALPLGATVTIGTVTTTATQIRIPFTAPDAVNPCKVEISEFADFHALIKDVDPALFPSSNLDSRNGSFGASRGGVNRVFVAGTRTVQKDANGANDSRAAQQGTTYYYRVSCGVTFSDQASGNTNTAASAPVGRSVRDPMLADANNNPLWPDFSQSDRSEVVVEPMTGAKIKHFGMPADAVRIYNNINFGTCSNLTSGWLIGSSCTAGTGSATTFTSTSCTGACASLAMSYLALASNLPPGEEQESNEASIAYLMLHLTGQCSGANVATADCTSQVCWSWDGATCAGPQVDLLFPTTPGIVSLCAKDGTTNCVTGDLLGADYRGYLHSTLGTGYLTTSGTSSTVATSSAADCAILKQNDTLVVTNASLSVLNLQVASKSCPGSVTVTAPTNLDPSAFTGSPGFPFHYYDNFYNNPRWSLLIRKKSLTANNTLSITSPGFDVTLGGFSSTTSAGYNELCNQYVDSNGFRKCRMTTKIYAYQPTTGEVRFLGQWYGVAGSNGIRSGEQCQQTGGGSTFWDTANSFYCIAPEPAPMDSPPGDGKPHLWHVLFTGNTANDVSKPPAPGQNTSFVAGSTVTDVSGDLLAAVHTFDSTFDSSVYGNVGMCGFSGGRYFHFFIEAGAQDTLAWAAVFDTTTNAVIAAWKTWASPSPSRWSVNHACFWFAPTDGASATTNLMGTDLKRGRDDTPNGPLYHLTITQAITTSTTTFNITSTTPVALQTPTTLQAVLPGDTMVCGGDGGETMQISVINSTTNITVVRGTFMSSPIAFPSPPTDCWMTPWLNHTNIEDNDSGEFWNFLAEPHGPTTNSHVYLSECPGGGHAFYYSQTQAGSPDLAGNYVSAGIENSLGSFPLCQPASFSQLLAYPFFSATALGPQSSGGHEAHPSFKPTPYPLIVDNHPDIGEGTNLDSGLTLVTGTLFRLTYNETASYPGADNISLKFLPRMVTSQKKLFTDVSGPHSTIGGTLADAFKYCVVVIANECQAGSTPGQIYINSPYMNPAYYTNAFGVVCWLGSTVDDDLCLYDDGQRDETVTGYVAPSTGATVTNPNQSFPIIEQFGMLPKGAPGTSNTKAFYGNWAYGGTFVVPPYSLNYRTLAYIVKTPDSSPVDGIDRSVFSTTTVTVSSPPMGTNNAIVRFGYVEYGSTGADPWSEHFCNTRRDQCIAASTSINPANPFLWTVEGAGGVEAGIAGVACASSCSIPIPTIPGYVVYPTVVFRNASNVTVGILDIAPGGGLALPVAPTITTTCPLPDATQGVSYSDQLTATGTAPITWTISSGTLPTGLSLVVDTITGIPTGSGTSSFSIQAANSVGNSLNGPVSCSIHVNVVTPQTNSTIIRGAESRRVVIR